MPKEYALLPIFRSDTMARLVARLYVSGATESMSQLARALGVSAQAVSAAVPDLERSAVVTVQTVGTTKFVSANQHAPFYRPLRELLEIVAGPPVVLAQELAGVPGIDEAYIYGSWAARDSGVPGRQPKDIDVLIVGAPPRLALASACASAATRLGREVNPTIAPTDVWGSREDAFFGALAREPLVRVLLHQEEDNDEPVRTDDDRAPAGDWAAALLQPHAPADR